MSVLVNSNTRLLVQGFTGKEGTFHAQHAISYGTNVVGGITPGKGRPEASQPSGLRHRRRSRESHWSQCLRHLRAPPFAADAGLALVVCITEGIPINDMIKAWDI
jgi:succinyl-CoA synthetase alpha subunit